MSDFGSDEYWEAEQLAQYECEMYEQQLREQAELEYIQFAQHCLEIANDWLLGELTECEATTLLYNANAGDSLIEWAEEVLEGI